MVHPAKIRRIVDALCSKGVLRSQATFHAMKGMQQEGSRANCERCGQETTFITASFFDGAIICHGCKRAEESHPQFADAKLAVLEAADRGNCNFTGVGLPSDLQK